MKQLIATDELGNKVLVNTDSIAFVEVSGNGSRIHFSNLRPLIVMEAIAEIETAIDGINWARYGRC